MARTSRSVWRGVGWSAAIVAAWMSAASADAAPRHFLAGSRLSGDKAVYTYAFPEPILSTENGTAGVTLPGCENAAEAGEPVLPVHCAVILMPPGKTLRGITVRERAWIPLPGAPLIRHGQKPFPLSGPPPEETPPKAEIYGSDEPFPRSVSGLCRVQIKHGRPFLVVPLRPVRYRPFSRRLFYMPEVEVLVSWDDAPAGSPTAAKSVPLKVRSQDEADLRYLADNPALAASAGPSTGMLAALESSPLPPGDFEHVIITTGAFLQTPPPWNFQTLSQARNAAGITSTNVPLEWIYAHYSGLRPKGDSDNPTRIRNFIADAYVHWGTRYVLLGGNVQNLPARVFWVQTGDRTTTLPADMYYGCLDGTFDNDADGTYAEPTDGPEGGEVDLAAEVYVGRACVAHTGEVANVVRKILDYEDAPTSHLARITMLGEYLGNWGAYSYASPMLEQIRLGGTYDGYATVGFENSAYSNSFDTSGYLYQNYKWWNATTVINAINNGVHVLDHIGHASPSSCMALSTGGLTALTNRLPFIAYSQGCDAGAFDGADCFAEVLTTMRYGAAAAIMNARLGWVSSTSTDGKSHRYNRRFWHAVLGSGFGELGRMNQLSKELGIGQLDQTCMRWIYYELTLFGDPAMKFAPRIVGTPPTIGHTPLENTTVTNAPYRVDAVIRASGWLDTNALRVCWSTNASTITHGSNALLRATNDLYFGWIPAQPRGARVCYWIEAAAINGARSTDPPDAPSSFHEFRVTDALILSISGFPARCGSVTPAYGSHAFASGVVVRAWADRLTIPSNGLRYARSGWTGTGSAPASGDVCSVSFALDADSTLTWRWNRECGLIQTSTVPSLLSTTTWWSASSTAETVVAPPALTLTGAVYCLASWMLDGARAPDGTGVTVNPLTGIAMETGRVAVAVYLPENRDEDGNGLADWWERFYFGATGIAADADPDGDGFVNRDESRDWANPRDAASMPAPPLISHVPLSDPQARPAPYAVHARVTDSRLVSAVRLRWTRSGGPVQEAAMTAGAAPDEFRGNLPSPGTNADAFAYAIQAWDQDNRATTNGWHAFRVAYPVAAVTPTNLQVVLLAGSNSTAQLALRNTGNTNLAWRLEVLPLGFCDDVESETNGWQHDGAADLWHVTTNRSYSGSHSWHCGYETRRYENNMRARLVSPSTRVGSRSTLSFRYWIATEIGGTYAWDNGMVEISTNGGLSFARIAPLGGYPCLDYDYEPPWPRDTPCLGGSGGWRKATFDLAPFAGREARFRFYFISDGGTVDEGWYIDDVIVQPCALPGDWMALSPTNGLLAAASSVPLSASFRTAGVPTGWDAGALLRLLSNDPLRPTNAWQAVLSVRSAPIQTLVSAFQTSRDGSGLVTITNLISDADGEPCGIGIEYSTDGGASWTHAWIASARARFGGVTVANGAPRQVYGLCTTNNWAPATNRVSVVWDTRHGTEPITLSTQTLVRTRGWDGRYWSAAETSAAFMVDNEPPSGPAFLHAPSHPSNRWSSNRTVVLTWDEASDGEGVGGVRYDCMLTNRSGGVGPVAVTTDLALPRTAGADGTNWWGRVRARDARGNAGAYAEAGPFRIDASPPECSNAVVRLSHSPFGNYVVGQAVTGSWEGFVDRLSGISNYFFGSEDGSGTTNGRVSMTAGGVLDGAAPDRTNRVYVWARDRAGGIGGAASATMLVLDPEGDFDRDGLRNVEEEVAGTDAGDAGSVFEFQPAAEFATGGLFVVRWSSVAGRLYSLRATSDLRHAASAWNPVAGCSNVPGTGGMMSYTDRTSEAGFRFYRLKVRP